MKRNASKIPPANLVPFYNHSILLTLAATNIPSPNIMARWKATYRSPRWSYLFRGNVFENKRSYFFQQCSPPFPCNPTPTAKFRRVRARAKFFFATLSQNCQEMETQRWTFYNLEFFYLHYCYANFELFTHKPASRCWRESTLLPQAIPHSQANHAPS